MMSMRLLFWPILAFLAGSLAAFVLRWVVLASLRRWAAQSSLTQEFGDAIRAPSVLWCVLFGLWVASEVALESSQLPPRLQSQVALVLGAGLILSVTITLANLVSTLVGRASGWSALGGAVTGLAQGAARATVFIVGLLIVLAVLGVQITPILTALGIGGLAVALALQDILGNLFAGFHLLADKPIRVGDYVKVGDNAEGYVMDIGWRSTRIRSLANNVVVVPNQTVARATITNYDLPEPMTAIGLKISVDYGADPGHVQSLLLEEVTRAVSEVPGLLKDPAPDVSLIPGFGEYSLDFTVGFHVARFVDQYRVQHELRQRIFRRLHSEGITVAPARVVRIVGEAPAFRGHPEPKQAEPKQGEVEGQRK